MVHWGWFRVVLGCLKCSFTFRAASHPLKRWLDQRLLEGQDCPTDGPGIAWVLLPQPGKQAKKTGREPRA